MGYSQRYDCLKHHFCFWHPTTNRCQDLDENANYSPSASCRLRENVHSCYANEICFWHHRLEICESLDDYLKFTTTTLRPSGKDAIERGEKEIDQEDHGATDPRKRERPDILDDLV